MSAKSVAFCRLNDDGPYKKKLLQEHAAPQDFHLTRHAAMKQLFQLNSFLDAVKALFAFSGIRRALCCRLILQVV